MIIAEIGVDMSRFPTAAHLASWAGMCPGNHESAGKRRSGKARKGDAALRSALCESAWTVSRTRGYLGSLYRQLHRRFGKKGETKAAFAVGHAILVIVWHLLHDERDYEDLGADFLDRRNDTEARRRYLVRQLESSATGHHRTSRLTQRSYDLRAPPGGFPRTGRASFVSEAVFGRSRSGL